MEAILFPFDIENVLLLLWENCPLDAKYCHKCGDRLKREASVDEGSRKDESGCSASANGNGTRTSGLVTFAQFRAQKEEDRS